MGRVWRWITGAFSRTPREKLDPDVRDVFLSELDEVIESLESLLPDWRQNRADAESLQEIRRGFHTLKGSGLTAGANTLGHFCGQMEKLTLRLIERRTMPAPESVATIESAIRLLTHCSRSIRDDAPMPPELRALADQAQKLMAGA